MKLKQYDPNSRFGATTIALKYMLWDYSAIFEVTVGGNCKGISVLDCAIERHAELLFDEQGEAPTIILKRPAEDGDGEDELICEQDDFDDTERWLGKMLVGLEIVAFEPEVAAPTSPTPAQEGKT